MQRALVALLNWRSARTLQVRALLRCAPMVPAALRLGPGASHSGASILPLDKRARLRVRAPDDRPRAPAAASTYAPL